MKEARQSSSRGERSLWVKRTAFANVFLSISRCFCKGLTGVLACGAGGSCECAPGRVAGAEKEGRITWNMGFAESEARVWEPWKWNWVRARPLVAVWKRAWKHEYFCCLLACMWPAPVYVPTTPRGCPISRGRLLTILSPPGPQVLCPIPPRPGAVGS